MGGGRLAGVGRDQRGPLKIEILLALVALFLFAVASRPCTQVMGVLMLLVSAIALAWASMVPGGSG